MPDVQDDIVKKAFDRVKQIRESSQKIQDKQDEVAASGSVPTSDRTESIQKIGRISSRGTEGTSLSKLRGYQKRRNQKRSQSQELSKKKDYTPLVSSQEKSG